MRTSLIAAVGLLALCPGGGLYAQEPVRGEVTVGPERMMRFVMSRRARLGLTVNLRARETDSVGAYVDAVTPNGPAAKSGIRSGDIITKVDQKSVLSGGETSPREGRESLPGLRLIELAATLAPNDTIELEFRRGKDRKTVSVVTADEPRRAFAFRYGPGGQPGRGLNEEEIFVNAPFLYGSALADLELAPLNPDLGQYFGTASGVLVINVPAGSELGFKGGDVVLAVDGRKPESPSHLLRILRSYGDTEGYKAEVLRNRKRVTVSGELGGER